MSAPTETQRQLRLLGEAVLQLADGKLIERTWLDEHFTASSVARQTTHAGRLLTVTEACQQLRISRWSLYGLINRNDIATVTIGRRRLVPQNEIDRFVRTLTAVGGTQ